MPHHTRLALLLTTLLAACEPPTTLSDMLGEEPAQPSWDITPETRRMDYLDQPYLPVSTSVMCYQGEGPVESDTCAVMVWGDVEYWLASPNSEPWDTHIFAWDPERYVLRGEWTVEDIESVWAMVVGDETLWLYGGSEVTRSVALADLWLD